MEIKSRECLICGNTGYVDCPSCVKGQVTCPDCLLQRRAMIAESGKIDEDKIFCTCTKGKVQCTRCHGTGKQKHHECDLAA